MIVRLFSGCEVTVRIALRFFASGSVAAGSPSSLLGFDSPDDGFIAIRLCGYFVIFWEIFIWR